MARIDQNQCTGCGICVNQCPDGIEMQGGVAKIKDPEASCLEDAASVCPAGAIEIDTTKNQDSGDKTTNKSNPGRSGNAQQMGAGKRSGRGRGRGPGAGVGPGGYCVCPNCGYKQQHQRGTPCIEMHCPSCGAQMIRED